MKNPFKIGSYLTLLLLFAVLYPLSVPAQRVGGKLLCRIPKNGERFTVEAVSVAEPSDSVIWDFSDIKPLLCADDAADALVYAGAMDFHDGANEQTEYAYDANGNLTKDLNRGIESITYDRNNMPTEITFTSGARTCYTYDADGRKLRVSHYGRRGEKRDELDYIGDMVLRNGALERTLTPNGYIVNDTVYYYVKDYQGNVRNVVREDGVVVESNEYYPYGGLFSATPSVQPYKYGAKELDRTHGLDWYDSKARFYDSILLRTNSMDKKAGDYTWLSPYLWCAANPIHFTDPDGEKVRPKSSKELGIIHNTLPKDARSYVRIDNNGFIDNELLNLYKGDSSNFKSLKILSNSNRNIEILLDDKYTYMCQDGRLESTTMQYYDFDPQYDLESDKDISGETINGVSTGESGFLGKVLFPDKDGVQNSANHNIIVIINKNLSSAGAAEVYSHEVNGHALLYIMNGGNHAGASHQTINMVDVNRTLIEMIIKSKKETIKNMR